MNMNQVQKIILVPFEEWEKMQTNQEVGQEVHPKMEQICHMKNQERKVKKRIHIQKIHLNQEKQFQNPTTVKLSSVEKKNTGKTKKNKRKIFQVGEGLKIDTIVEDLPNDVHIIAKSLLLFIKDKKIMTWNNKGEIIFKSKCLKKTNIRDLILHAVTKMKEKPSGYKCFYKILKRKKFQLSY